MAEHTTPEDVAKALQFTADVKLEGFPKVIANAFPEGTAHVRPFIAPSPGLFIAFASCIHYLINMCLLFAVSHFGDPYGSCLSVIKMPIVHSRAYSCTVDTWSQL